jgi:type IX secretion system PorP/SprF family membrane protein
MKKLLFFLVVFGLSNGLFGQQQGVYSNFLLNDYYYNPAIAGTKDVHTASVGYRNQWVGFQDAPVNMYANLYGSYKDQGKYGYGASITSQRSGLTSSTGVYLNYAHHFKLSKTLKLGLGIQPGYLQYRVQMYDAVMADQNDPVFTDNVYMTRAFDINAGFNLYHKNFFVMGSAQHLLGNSSKLSGYNSSLAFHYNFIGGYNFRLKNQPIDIQPSFMIKYVKPTPVQWTLMVKGTYQEKYWVGLLFRSNDALGVVLGMKIKDRLNIGYGYDIGVSKIRTYNSGSHEIFLSYAINKKRPTLEEEDDLLNNSILEEMKKKMDKKEKQ